MTGHLIIGASHSLRFAEAIGAISATWEEASRDLIPLATHSGRPVSLVFVTNRPGFIEFAPRPGGAPEATFGPLMDRIRAFNRPDAKVVFSVGGNEHNINFMRADARPFDFHLPGLPPPDGSRQVLPAGEMRGVVRKLLARTLAVTEAIARELPLAQRYYLPPPPPIPSEAHIRKNAEMFDFADGVEDANVRLKLHRLYLEAVAEFCARTGIRFLAPPEDLQDAKGFLLEPYWSGATHATAEYYDGLVAELGL